MCIVINIKKGGTFNVQIFNGYLNVSISGVESLRYYQHLMVVGISTNLVATYDGGSIILVETHGGLS